MGRKKNRDRASEAVRGPAVSLLILATLALLLDSFIMVGSLREGIYLSRQHDRGELTEQEYDGRDEALATVWGFSLSVIMFHGVMVVGAITMLRLGSYSMAQAGASVALIPCISPFFLLGIPFALWALSVLGEPRVRSGFRSK